MEPLTMLYGLYLGYNALSGKKQRDEQEALDAKTSESLRGIQARSGKISEAYSRSFSGALGNYAQQQMEDITTVATKSQDIFRGGMDKINITPQTFAQTYSTSADKTRVAQSAYDTYEQGVSAVKSNWDAKRMGSYTALVEGKGKTLAESMSRRREIEGLEPEKEDSWFNLLNL